VTNLHPHPTDFAHEIRIRRMRILAGSVTSLASTCDSNGSPAHTTASVVQGGTRIQGRTRSTKNELEECSQ